MRQEILETILRENIFKAFERFRIRDCRIYLFGHRCFARASFIQTERRHGIRTFI